MEDEPMMTSSDDETTTMIDEPRKPNDTEFSHRARVLARKQYGDNYSAQQLAAVQQQLAKDQPELFRASQEQQENDVWPDAKPADAENDDKQISMSRTLPGGKGLPRAVVAEVLEAGARRKLRGPIHFEVRLGQGFLHERGDLPQRPRSGIPPREALAADFADAKDGPVKEFIDERLGTSRQFVMRRMDVARAIVADVFTDESLAGGR